MNFNTKITPNQRAQLMQIYLHMGKEESKIACAEYGLDPKYMAKHLSLIGKLPPRKFKGYAVQRKTNIDHSDPRWAWAVSRGPVVAP